MGRYITGTYHQRTHPETGQTPVTRWSAGGWLPRMPESLEQLDLLLLTVATPRVVHRDGIRCHGLRYLDLTVAAYVGEQVTIRYDPRDLAEIRVYHRGGFLTRAVSPELAAATISLKQRHAARGRRRRELTTQLRQRRSLADALVHPVWQPVPDDIPAGTRPVPRPEATTHPPAPGSRRPAIGIYREN